MPPIRLPGLLLPALLTLFVASPTRASSPDPQRLYGAEGLHFQILRDGSPVGSHTVAFSRDGTILIATSHTRITVSLAFIPLYAFDYRSTGRWQDGRLVELEAHVKDNGHDAAIRVTTAPGRADMILTGPSGTTTAPADTLPTNHWNPAVIGADRVINTLTGKLNRVTMTALGEETVPTGTGPRPATRYHYGGDLDADVWYDARGRWVRLSFPGRDGSRIDYTCLRCGGAGETAQDTGATAQQPRAQAQHP